MTAWQPIDTAPDDGTPFLASQWDARRGGWAIGIVYYEHGEIVCGISGAAKAPTHWTELPDLPEPPTPDAPQRVAG